MIFEFFKKILKAGSISAKQWIKDNPDKCEEILIYPETTVEYPTPRTIEDNIHPSFIGSKETIPAFYVRKIKNGKCFTGNGLVLTPDNKPLSEYSVEDQHPLRNKRRYKFNNPIKLDGTVVLLSTDPNNVNFYHWMIESFPKLHLLQKSGFKVNKYIICNKMPYQKQLLEIAGIKEEQIIWFDENTLVQADELIVPDIINNFRAFEFRGKLSYNAKYIPNWIFDFYNELLYLYLKESEPQKIFISREKANYRNIENENDLFEMLLTKGFKKVFLEDLSIIEQANLFHNAEFIVSPHGAGLTNLLFCKLNTKVIEIFPPTYLCNNQQLLARALNLDYAYIVCDTSSDADTDLLRENIVVDIKKLEKAFNLF